ncbi:UvrD-helicase domain-containing protein [Tropicimonas sp. IMCC34011]|uniref:UvrD-helicase domain-containing protein n=1 Tax=Tropicimonas sp. IMCC34011 TaxID=2248759 RepID=UPI000E260245|nr:UvrD-helicase domain-containing protein [Tropicimonas sp. IMCC34011]
MKLVSRPLPAFLSDPFRKHPRALALQDDIISASGGAHARVHLSEIAAAPVVQRGRVSARLTLDLGDQSCVLLPGVQEAPARAFAQAVEIAWSGYNLAQLSREDDAIAALLTAIEGLKAPAMYPAACLVGPVASKAADLDARVLKKLNPTALGVETMARLAPIMELARDPEQFRETAVAAFVNQQLADWKEFFDTVESMPLTPEQRLSVVVDEDATLVLAGAGSGKTSVITAKAAYLVKAAIRRTSGSRRAASISSNSASARQHGRTVRRS